MNLKSASGLTLVELLVVVLVLGILSAALFPAGTDPVKRNMAVVGMRGRDIYVALAAASAEREALGMGSLWPRDVVSGGVTNASVSGMPEFANSTDYFAWLLMALDGAIPGWNPQVKELGVDKLSGAGVKACPTNRCLTAEDNLWTVAKNVRADMDDIIPVLISRNIDAWSLAARACEQDLQGKTLRFDPCWQTPFGDKGFVLIRKGGAIFKARAKHMGYKVVYQNNVFDTALATNGTALPPLKYLTPTREVTPGAQAYADGAEIAYRQAGGWWGKLWIEACKVVAGVWLLALFWAILYLLSFAHYTTRRKNRGLSSRLAAPVLGGWFCHYLSVVLYVTALFRMEDGRHWAYACVAVGAQAVGIALAFALPEQERTARWRQVLWVLLVPLQLGALFAFLSLCCR